MTVDVRCKQPTFWERLTTCLLHVVSANLPAGTADEAVRHRLGKLDYWNYSAISRRVDFGELPGKVIRPRHVAPLCASGLGYPNAAGVGSYGGQYLYLGPVGVADRHS